MKCSYSQYEHGYNTDTTRKQTLEIAGEEGDFFKLLVELQRDSLYYNSKEVRFLYACPSCSKTFIDRW